METFLAVITGGEGVAAVINGFRPGILPNTLQYIGQPPQKRLIWPQMSRAEVEKL